MGEQKVQSANAARVVFAVAVDVVEPIAGKLDEVAQERLGGSVSVGQEHQAWRQWLALEIGCGGHDEEAGEVHVRQARERHSRIVGGVGAEILEQGAKRCFVSRLDASDDGDRRLDGGQTAAPVRSAPARGNWSTKLMVLSGP